VSSFLSFRSDRSLRLVFLSILVVPPPLKFFSATSPVSLNFESLKVKNVQVARLRQVNHRLTFFFPSQTTPPPLEPLPIPLSSLEETAPLLLFPPRLRLPGRTRHTAFRTPTTREFSSETTSNSRESTPSATAPTSARR